MRAEGKWPYKGIIVAKATIIEEDGDGEEWHITVSWMPRISQEET